MGWGEVLFAWFGLGFLVFFIYVHNFTSRIPLEELMMYPWDCGHINHDCQAMQSLFSLTKAEMLHVECFLQTSLWGETCKL